MRLRLSAAPAEARDQPWEVENVLSHRARLVRDWRSLQAYQSAVLMTAAQHPRLDALAALIKGEDVAWSAFGVTAAQFVEECRAEDLIGLVHERLRGRPRGADWPRDLHNQVAQEARAEAARELLRRREITSALDALAAVGVYPILLKGTALAYSIYPSPVLRPRCDTDLLVKREQVDTVRRVMSRLGYITPTQCDGELLFRQFQVAKEDAFGVDHALDFHWKISTQSLFADLLRHDELASAAEPVPVLGHHARMTGSIHALFLACIHPVMHHRNTQRLIWLYDIHALASRLSDAEFGRFADLVVERRVSAIAAHELALACFRFGTRVPSHVTGRLGARRVDEPCAVYLRSNRRWSDEAASCVRGLPRWTDRYRLLREIVFPGSGYMLRKYGLGSVRIAVAFLPALYFHRGVYGVWKVLVGRK
jgi:hypothetical protein